MKKAFTIGLISLLLIFNFSLIIRPVLAETAQDTALGGLTDTAKETGLQAGNPATTIGAALGVLLSVLGLIMLIIIVYAGVIWMTAGGATENVKRARDMMIEASLGLAVCLASYAITQYIVARITTAVAG